MLASQFSASVSHQAVLVEWRTTIAHYAIVVISLRLLATLEIHHPRLHVNKKGNRGCVIGQRMTAMMLTRVP